MIVREALTYEKMPIYNNDLCMPLRLKLLKNICSFFYLNFIFLTNKISIREHLIVSADRWRAADGGRWLIPLKLHCGLVHFQPNSSILIPLKIFGQFNLQKSTSFSICQMLA